MSVLDRFPTKHLPGRHGPRRARTTPLDLAGDRSRRGRRRRRAGVGEFILWPYIASQVGLVFLWAALIGIVTQWFINMEIERYTLATGETALTGFSRFWRHWGLVFAILVYFANLWPGWVTSSATMVTYLYGGSEDATSWIAIGMLLVIGVDADAGAGDLHRAGAGRVRQGRPGAAVPRGGAGVRHHRRRVERTAEDGDGAALPRRTRLRAGALGARVRGRRRRPEPVPEQLDPRQAIRARRLRAAAGEPDHRPRGAGARRGLHLRAGRGQHGPAGGAGGRSPTSSRR